MDRRGDDFAAMLMYKYLIKRKRIKLGLYCFKLKTVRVLDDGWGEES